MFNVVCVLEPLLERLPTALEKRVKSARDWLSELLETLMYFKFNWANIKYINKRAWRDSAQKKTAHCGWISLRRRRPPFYIYIHPTKGWAAPHFVCICVCVRGGG